MQTLIPVPYGVRNKDRGSTVFQSTLKKTLPGEQQFFTPPSP